MSPLRSQSESQLTLPFERDAAHLEAELREAMGKKISLVITDNASTMISFRQWNTMVSVRLHHMFLSAGQEVLGELVRFLKGSRARTPALRNFIRKNSQAVRKPLARHVSLRTKGRYHDLRPIADQVNDEYFGGRITAGITWGRSAEARVRRRTLGSYSCESNVIRISRVLDKRHVPRYFVEFIIYHEMIHADMGIEEEEGRRRIHSREFRRRERLFRHSDRALTWEKSRMG